MDTMFISWQPRRQIGQVLKNIYEELNFLKA